MKEKRKSDSGSSDPMAFETWFANQLGKKLVQKWQRRELEVFFTKQGLTQKEPSQKYEESFKRYRAV